MAYDSFEDTLHLTKTGWLEFPHDKPLPDPLASDRPVEVWRRSTAQASPWSREVVSCALLWRDKSLSPMERKKVWNSFPIPSGDFSENEL